MNNIIIIIIIILCIFISSILGIGVFFATQPKTTTAAPTTTMAPKTTTTAAPTTTMAQTTTTTAAPTTTIASTLPSTIDFVKGWQGAHDNTPNKVAGPEQCRQLALKDSKYVAWGFRNNNHSSEQWRNTCFLYTQFSPYSGNNNDDIHISGCLQPGQKVASGCI